MKHEAFYAVAAQVIPVLWIILVFQLRLFGRKVEEDGASSVGSDERHKSANLISLLLIVVTGVSMWIGEGMAIDALLSEDDSGFSRGWIRFALYIGTFFVFFIPVFPWIEALLERTPLEPWRQRWFGWVERKQKRKIEEKPPDSSG